MGKTEIQSIFAEGATSYLARFPVNDQQRKAIYSIVNCQRPGLGKHIDKCNRCGHLEVFYNSCRNRNCPKCQWGKQLDWVNHLRSSLPPVRYFHLVFTLPHELNKLVYKYQKDIYPLLFKSSAETVLQVALKPGYLGAHTGCLSVLHTWGQNLQYHPHIHMLVPAGGMSEDKMEWLHSGKKFFAPVKVLSKVYRGKFISMLEVLIAQGKVKLDLTILKDRLYKKDWVVYSKKAFAGPGQVLQYLGRYTHRIAISNSRIVAHEKGIVSFRWKDYRSKGAWKTMQLDRKEFIRRFLFHVLPSNFYKIRYYGVFALAHRKQVIARCIMLLRPENTSCRLLPTKGRACNYRKCPICKCGQMLFLKLLVAEGKPG